MTTERIEHDYYPTPPDVVEALRRQLRAKLPWVMPDGFPFRQQAFLDPAAGAGTMLHWLEIDHANRHAIEIRTDLDDMLGRFVAPQQTRTGVDALNIDWPPAHIVCNPPFKLLDAFVRKALNHICDHRTSIAAILMPTQWMQAQRREWFPTPNYFWPLRWRPRFRPGSGNAMHDVAWAVWQHDANYDAGQVSWLSRPSPISPQSQALYQELLGLAPARLVPETDP